MLALAYMYTMRHQELAVRPYEANRRATGPWHDSTRLRDSTHCAIVSRRNKGDNQCLDLEIDSGSGISETACGT